MQSIPLHRMTDQGWFRPSPWLYLCLIFLGRTWLLFVGAAASREAGADLLALFYPNKLSFYCGLAIGTPALCLLWLQGLRHRFAWVGKIWRWGFSAIIVTLLLDLALQLQQLFLHNGRFVAGPAAVLLLSLWALWYLLKSRSSRLVFAHKGHLFDDKNS
ncbi:DUF2919 domain-containing protein [uncultured Ferrimonas sp.]|uniref:DUF2919 domain-containing protein n=1 Tax=uncultured Ferrimonas sp. TaxID=432640 RepID=UPI0026134615|nr:DUF2919 domain-containing protein [uncultured Ferrimonas sp.]